ncbi:hypothetical protein LOTGIDRAFT_230720 [Lottia gigantea]|uniref:AAA+ ATPase domain-containing protein n=1 Tax=Lottia gigantea TaxID=225164 RepID=V4AVS1_LOTGI|nr:hypothetical protein LOTGIDRAFT_230720 [Lottia gigantea]ESP01463.1 hypothetical protein LOTGIDRAFT_230720 [Lottia gigantea]
MDEYIFEAEFADELEALADFEDDYPENTSYCKSKKALNFETPKSKNSHAKENGIKSKENDFNDSLLEPLVSPECIPNGSLLRSKGDKSNKRCRVEEFEDFSGDSEDEDISCSKIDTEPEIEPLSKRQRLHDLTPQKPLSVSKSSSGKKQQEKDTEDDNVFDPEFLKATAIADDIIKRRNQTKTFTKSTEIVSEISNVKRLLSVRPSGNFFNVTNTNGNRFYVKIKDEDKFEREIQDVCRNKRITGLLSVPYSVLKHQVEQERQNKIIEEARKITDEINREIDNDLGLDFDNVPETLTEPQKYLWVEKYAPRRYTELLSEEAINRTLLHWIKLWDHVVFGKELPSKHVKDKKKQKEVKKWKKLPELTDELDKFNRPLYKVVLLCGPPGLGKTTLAQIVASHAGYNVVEMNASDDRSAEVFKNKVEAATQMKSVIEADPRPNCLVIDEIDGAPQPAINILLNLIKRTDVPLLGKKKKEEGDVLLRPIICICNDQYVTSLRQLRQLALILSFPQTESTRLASRLYEVIRHEHIKGDMNALLALCERTDNDIRSCLNTLQFVRQNRKELTVQSIQGMSIGQKDAHRSLFATWYEIFTMPRAKQNRFMNVRDMSESDKKKTVNSTTPGVRFQNILMVAQAAGEYDKIRQGLFENYLEAKSKDPHLLALNLANEWIGFTDLIQKYTNHSQDYSVMKYVPFLPVTFHLLYASYNPPRIQYPHTQFEIKTKETKSINLIESMMADMLPSVRRFVNQPAMVMDVIPPLLDIMQPSLRPVNTQLYSQREKDEMSNLIRIMIAYNMTYRQEKQEDGQYNYTIEPKIDEIVKFPGMKQHRQLTYAAKQLIAREIDLEKMRRYEARFTAIDSSEKTSGVTSRHITGEKNNDNTSSGPSVPNHLQTLQAKPLQDKRAVNFFSNFTRIKREVRPEKLQEEREEKKSEILATDIWFHFKEGFSNAVRRNVKIQDLL